VRLEHVDEHEGGSAGGLRVLRGEPVLVTISITMQAARAMVPAVSNHTNRGRTRVTSASARGALASGVPPSAVSRGSPPEVTPPPG